jgi:uncharacterized membrane protein YGL010W
VKTYHEWMHEYAESHQHPLNQIIHKVCVPLVMFSILGLLWTLPVPALFSALPYLNWATVFAVLCLLFYLRLSLKMFVGMLLQLLAMCLVLSSFESTELLRILSLIIFIAAWIGQFIGHKIEGKKPSFFKDILFLLIGPLWVTRSLYRKMGISS